MCVAAGVTALASYLPAWGEAPGAIRYMLEFQSRHNAKGHGVEIDDVVYKFPPWWAYLWWQWEFYGTLASVSLGVGVVVAVLRRRALELYLLTAALVPFLLLSFYVQVKLSHYIEAWQPPLILLLTVAAGNLARRRRMVGWILAVLLLAPFAYLGIQTLQAVSQVQPGVYAAVAEHLKDTDHDQGPILVRGTGGVLKSYLPKAQVLRKPDEAQGQEIEAVIVDISVSERKPNRSVENYLATNKDEFEHSESVGDVEVYIRKPAG